MSVSPPPLIIVWLDCLAGDVFVDMYEKGELSNLSEFFEDGVFVKNAASCFPTVSESVEGGVISGFYAGETNMVGERYFSRKDRTIKHYKYNASAWADFNPVLKDRVIDAIVGDSISIGRIIKSSNLDIIDVKAGNYERRGELKLVRRRIEVASKIISSRRPKLFFFTISADFISHVYGRDSVVVRSFIREFDKEFTLLVETLNETYGRGKYAIFVFSDHGSAPVSKHLDLPELLSEHGFNAASADILIRRDDANSAALSNGRRMGLVYIAHPEYGWSRKPSYKMLRSYRLGGEEVDLLRLLAPVSYTHLTLPTN